MSEELELKKPNFVWKKFAPREENLVPELFETIEQYGYLQLPWTGIAAMLGISYTLLKNLQDEIPEFVVAYDRGKSRAIADITKKYVNNIALMDGHPNQARALEFVLERKGGWVKAPDTAIQINNMPASFPTITNQDLDNILENDDV